MQINSCCHAKLNRYQKINNYIITENPHSENNLCYSSNYYRTTM
jgi:hypothetical protein